MLLALTLALSYLADAPALASQAPPAAPVNAPRGDTSQAGAAATSQAASSPSSNECPQTAPDSSRIMICAERPHGYRLNPDVMEARREVRGAGRPVRPGGTVRPDCATVGPAPCVNAGINLIAAAATAAEMAARLAKGQEVGSMFVTDPHPDEYHLYLMAKARREAEEKARAAAAANATQARVPEQPVQSNAPAQQPH